MAKKKFKLRPDIKNLIFNNVDRVRLLEYLGCQNIKVTGKEIRSTCPIHGGDGINNFILYNDTNWQCKSSGCHSNEKQDIFSLVMKSKGLKFKESLLLVASHASVNIDLEDSTYTATEEVISATNWANNVNKKAYKREKPKEITHSLIKNFMFNRNDYMIKRNFPEWVLNDFEVGFTSDWKLLSKLDIKPESRVTFPTIYNNKHISIQGRCVSGIGDKRKFPNNHWPRNIKYDIFSKFPKEHYLYNYDNATKYVDILGYVILVEGVTDVMRLHQYGIRNVVCGWGDSLSKPQKNLLIKMGVLEVVIMYDNDIAGKKAIETVIKSLQYMFDIYIANIPKLNKGDKKDPESSSADDVYYSLQNKYRRFRPKIDSLKLK